VLSVDQPQIEVRFKDVVDRLPVDPPSLAMSGETLTIEESMNLEGENGERHDVAGDREWSRAGG
jgi:hypothetical protein